jgi:hypothetical protein
LNQDFAQEQTLSSSDLGREGLAKLIGSERSVLNQNLPEWWERGEFDVVWTAERWVALHSVSAMIASVIHFRVPFVDLSEARPVDA